MLAVVIEILDWLINQHENMGPYSYSHNIDFWNEIVSIGVFSVEANTLVGFISTLMHFTEPVLI